MLPASILVTEGPDGVAIRLPPREPSLFRRLGWLLIGLGAFACAFGTVILTSVGWFQAGAFAAVPLLAASLLPVVAGLYLIWAGKHDSGTLIHVDAFSMSSLDTLGRFRRKHVLPLAQVRSVIVEPFLSNQSQPKRQGKFLGRYTQLRVLLESGDSRVIAPGYPRDLLVPVAEDLARRCRPDGTGGPPAVAGASTPAPIAWLNGVDRPVERIAVRLDRPSGSRVVVEEHADGINVVVPALGLRRGSRGLFTLAVIWCAILTVLIVALALAGLANPGPVIPALVLVPLWLIGIVLLLVAVNLGRRRAVLAVVGRRLLVMQSGAYRTVRREWEADGLSDIHPAPTGVMINNRPVMQLQVTPTAGKPFTLLSGRDEVELDWVAAMLRRALNMDGAATPPAGPERGMS